MLQLDHLFILVSPQAPEADALLDIGLLEGPSNAHPGQGTRNRRFFFNNTTLEFLFIHDIAEAMNGAGKRLQLMERAIAADGSPFGLIARWSDTDSEPQYPHWKYQPDYFPKPMSFFVGNNARNFAEPICICMPPSLPKSDKTPSPNNPDWVLTQLTLSVPGSLPSETLSTFGECNLVTIKHNEDHHVTLTFNNSALSKKHFFPDAQLSIEY